MEDAERELDELEQLHEEPLKSSKSETIHGHSRNASNVSTLSNTSELIADPEDDGGPLMDLFVMFLIGRTAKMLVWSSSCNTVEDC